MKIKSAFEKLSKNNMLSEEVLSKLNIEELKNFGLSTQKSTYIKNLAILSLMRLPAKIICGLYPTCSALCVK